MQTDLTAAQAAATLDISKAGVLAAIRAGSLRARKIESGPASYYLIKPEDLEEFKRTRPRPGRPKTTRKAHKLPAITRAQTR